MCFLFLNGIWFLFCYRKFLIVSNGYVQYKFLESLFIKRCGTYTLNSFSLALWRSRNEGSWKIDADKSCIELLKIVLRHTGHLHEESFGGIFRYSKEWKSFNIDIMSKSAQNTHLTAEPILKQCAVYGSRPPIASKPGLSSPEQYGLINITSQPWSDATCPRTTSDSAYFHFVTLF